MASTRDPLERRRAFIAELETLAGPVAGRTVLDLGCGRDALWTRAYVERGARVVALELDAGRCREAAPLLRAAAGAGCVDGLVRGDGEALPFAAASFAFVHCAQVLEHVANPGAFLRELERVLAPGGCAYVSAINRLALRDPHFGVLGVNYLPRPLADRLLVWMGATNPEGQTLARMHYFSRAGFRRLCAASGLGTVVDLKRRERLAARGPLAGRLADLWGQVHGAAFHALVRRRDAPVSRGAGGVTARRT